MTSYIRADNLNCNHRKVLVTAKDFNVKMEHSPITVVCIECKKYEVIEFK